MMADKFVASTERKKGHAHVCFGGYIDEKNCANCIEEAACKVESSKAATSQLSLDGSSVSSKPAAKKPGRPKKSVPEGARPKPTGEANERKEG